MGEAELTVDAKRFILESMTAREELKQELQQRISGYDETMLERLSLQMDELELQSRGLTQDFTDMINAFKERNKDRDPDEVLRQVTEAVSLDRQSRS